MIVVSPRSDGFRVLTLFVFLFSGIFGYSEMKKKKKLFVRPSRSINGELEGRSRSQPKYSLHRKSAHSWCLNKVLFIIRMATAALSSTLGHRKVLWMLGDLSLTTSFFYSPPPRHTHTHIVFSSLICSNGYDSPLPFAKTFNFSFKYICSFFFPPPISVSLLFLLICKIGKKQYNVQKINR